MRLPMRDLSQAIPRARRRSSIFVRPAAGNEPLLKVLDETPAAMVSTGTAEPDVAPRQQCPQPGRACPGEAVFVPPHVSTVGAGERYRHVVFDSLSGPLRPGDSFGMFRETIVLADAVLAPCVCPPTFRGR